MAITPNLDIRESDLKGSAYRLNRVLRLLQKQVAANSTTVQNFISGASASSGGGSGPPPSSNSLLLRVNVTGALTITWSGPTPVDGQILTVRITMDATGHAVAWDPAWFIFPPTIPSTPNLRSNVLYTGVSGMWELNSMPIIGRHP